MLPIKKKLGLVVLSLLFSLVVGFILSWLKAESPAFTKIAHALDLSFYEIFFTPSRTIHPDFRLIDLDEQMNKPRSRAEIAELIRLLNNAGAKCIALDINFSDKSLDTQADAALVQAVSQAPQTVLALDFSTAQIPHDTTKALLDPLALPDSICKGNPIGRKITGGLNAPFYELLRLRPHLGHINNVDTRYHHFPAILHYEEDGNCYVALPVAIAMCFLSSGGVGPEFEVMAIPHDDQDHVLINFVEEGEFRQLTSSWDGAMILARSAPEKFRNAVVLIVNRANRLGEEEKVPTPLGLYPKWAILASLTNQLLLKNYVETSVVFYQIAVSMIFTASSLLLYFLIVAPKLKKPWRKIRYVFVAGSILFLTVIFLFLSPGRIWMGVTIPLLIYNTSMAIVRWQYYRFLNPLRYLNFDLAILELKEDKYPIKVYYSPAGSEEGDMYLRAALLRDEKFVNAMARLRAYSGDSESLKEEDLRTVGSALFQGVFHDDALELLRLSIDRAKEENSSLRLIMHLDPAELSSLPWELMHSPRPPRLTLALDKRISLVRFTPLKRSPPKLNYKTPLTILVAIASPVDEALKPLDIEVEKNAIAKILQPLTLAPLSRYLRFLGDIRLRFCPHATLHKLRNEIEQGTDIDVLHYIGHSRYDPARKTSYPELETSTGERDSVSAEALGEVLNDSPIKLVVLNSCQAAAAATQDAFSGLAQTLVSVGVPGVVAMQFPIRDDTAIEFSKIFYATLVKNFSVEAAVTKARQSIFTGVRDDRLGWATPVLFMRSKDGIVFASPD